MSPRRSPAGGPRRRGGGRPAPALCTRTHCKTKKVHDTYSAFRHGCRSDAAYAAEARYHKEIAAGIHTHTPLPVGPYARRLRALCAIGYDTPTLAQHCEFSPRRLAQIRNGTYSTTITRPCAEAVDALFRRLDGVLPPTGESAERALRYAAKHDWHPAAAYDDLDDMAEKPKPGRPATGFERGAPTARRTEVARRHSTGQKAFEIARDMGISERTVVRHLAALAAATTEAVAS